MVEIKDRDIATEEFVDYLEHTVEPPFQASIVNVHTANVREIIMQHGTERAVKQRNRIPLLPNLDHAQRHQLQKTLYFHSYLVGPLQLSKLSSSPVEFRPITDILKVIPNGATILVDVEVDAEIKTGDETTRRTAVFTLLSQHYTDEGLLELMALNPKYLPKWYVPLLLTKILKCQAHS